MATDGPVQTSEDTRTAFVRSHEETRCPGEKETSEALILTPPAHPGSPVNENRVTVPPVLLLDHVPFEVVKFCHQWT